MRPSKSRVWPKRGFAARRNQQLPGLFAGLRAVLNGTIRGDASNAGDIPVNQLGIPPTDSKDLAVTWVGHASFVVRIGGLTVLTDPVWSARIPGGITRLTPPGVPWDELPKVDAVVISHNHYDHLDAPTIKRLPRHTPIFVPAALARWFLRRGFSNVTELDWWEHAELASVRFDFVPSHHWSRRGLWDFCRTLWGGWVLTSSTGARVYFAGDTAYGTWFTEIGTRFPQIDIALLPIGAFEPRWFMRSSHVDPTEAVQAFRDIGARHLVPMHWGTFLLSAEPLLSPPARTAEAWSAANLPPDNLHPLAIGESFVLTADELAEVPRLAKT